VPKEEKSLCEIAHSHLFLEAKVVEDARAKQYVEKLQVQNFKCSVQL
jgi:hypothetical protein